MCPCIVTSVMFYIMLHNVSILQTFATVKQLDVTSECGQTTNDAGCMIGEALPNGRAIYFSVIIISHEIET